MNYQIEPLQPEDWPQVRSIYAESIKTGIATFDTKPPNWKDWDSSRLPFCRFVARDGIFMALLKALFAASENEKYWTLTAEIISKNRASLALHKKCVSGKLVIG